MDDFNLKINIDGSEVKQTLPTLKELRKELRAIQDTMAGLDEGSDEFLAAANKAGTLKHLIDEIRQATAGASADFGDMLGNVSNSAAGIIGTFLAIQGALNLLGVESEAVTESIKTMLSMMAITQGLTAIDAGIKSLAKLRNAITATTATAKLLKAALQPKVILAITAAITALTFAYDKLTEKSRAAAKAREEELKKAKELADAYNNDVAKAGANVLTIYEKLRLAFKQLGTQAEKQQWIKNNKTELNKLGISINNVNDAEDAFVKNSTKVIQGFLLRAEAAANENLAIKAYEEYLKKLEEVKLRAVKTGDIAKGKSFNVAGGDVTLDNAGNYRYTLQGATKRNREIIKDTGLDDLKALADKYVLSATELQEKANKLLGIGNQTVTETTNAVTKTTEQVKTAKLIAQESYDLEVARLNLQKEQGAEDVLGIKYYENLLKILNDYRNAIQNTGQATEMELIRIDTEIAKTNNIIQNFGNTEGTAEKSDFELRAEEIDTVLAQINAEFAASELNTDDEIKRLSEIILFEKERLQLLVEMGLEGTLAWYEQKAALSEYEKELIKTKKREELQKKAIQGWTSMATGSIDAVSGVLTELANTQDTTSKQGFETAKKLNIASATMSMLAGLTSIIAGTYTTHTGPWDIALAAVQAAAVLASGIININNIKKLTFDGGSTATSGSSANTNTSAINQMITPPVQLVNDVQGAELLGEIRDTKVYVTETDLLRTSKRVSVLESENTY